MILVVCAVSAEVAFLEPRPHVEVLVTGVGAIEAASNVSRALAQSPYDVVINAGIAGALDGCANVGDGIVVAEEMVELGVETGEPLVLPDQLRTIDRVASDLALVDRLAELSFATLRGITVGRVTATDATADRLRALGAQIESMEGFAVLRAAEIAGVPAIEVRGVSNRVGERMDANWNFAAGTAGLERVLNALLPIALDTHV